ncbi:hypothetical protein [Catellatospora methionotrophica]|uniref:hypothetical protein n=1 Tax=Catellatospora methionotrophica TaxID=121620 RepID=UPI0033F3F7E9
MKNRLAVALSFSATLLGTTACDDRTPSPVAAASSAGPAAVATATVSPGATPSPTPAPSPSASARPSPRPATTSPRPATKPAKADLKTTCRGFYEAENAYVKAATSVAPYRVDETSSPEEIANAITVLRRAFQAYQKASTALAGRSADNRLKAALTTLARTRGTIITMLDAAGGDIARAREAQFLDAGLAAEDAVKDLCTYG